jgi:ABC-type glycerol-3-phosphate transport system permease component
MAQAARSAPALRAKLHVPARSRSSLRRIGFAVAVTVMVLVSLFPFYWIFATSVQTVDSFNRGTAGLWPSETTLANYQDVFSKDHFLQPLLNSALVSVTTAVLSVVIGGLAGYALARLGIRGRGAILGYILAVAFFPIMAMIGPLFLVYKSLNLLDTYASLIWSYMIYTLPIATWVLTNFFSQIPKELEEAALVDGATRMQTLRRVVVPVALPGLFTALILSFILAWNDFVFALSFLETPSRYTAPLAIVNLGQSQFQVFFNRIDAAVVITTVPVAVVVLLAQRRIISGLTAGSLK